MANIKQYEIVFATFNPRRTGDLRYNGVQFIGKTIQWMASWIIEDGDYIGEWAMTPYKPPIELTPEFVWVPSGDLSICQSS